MSNLVLSDRSRNNQSGHIKHSYKAEQSVKNRTILVSTNHQWLMNKTTVIALAVILSAVIISGSILISSSSQDQNGVKFSKDSTGALTISGNGALNHSWKNDDSITSVYVKDGITSINSNAFENCKNLRSVVISNTVISIGSYAFQDCTNLRTVQLGNSIQSIGWGSFGGTSSLDSITIPASLASSKMAFSNSGVTSVFFEKGIKSIDNSMFVDCKKLESISFPDTLKRIGANSFSSCESLKKLSLPDSIQHIGSGSFGGCKSLNEIVLPDVPITIDSQAFRGCGTLRYVYIGHHVVSHTDAFKGDVIENLHYCNVNSFQNGATGLKVINLTLSTEVLTAYLFDKSYLKTLKITDEVKSIKEYSFWDCTYLESVELGKNVTSIGKYAFENCYSLAKVYNHSNLRIEYGSKDNGMIGYYANLIET